MMKHRTRIHGLAWRLRTGAFGFYVDGGSRVAGALTRAASPAEFLRPRGRVGRLGVAALVLAPAILLGSEYARDARNGSLLPDGPMRSEEVASLRASLDRYYEGEESGRIHLGGRELAIPVVVSGYTSRIAETDSTPFVTASNTTTRKGVIALSRDLLANYTKGAPFKFGDVIHLSGIGDFIVEDAMAGRWERRADIWFESLDDARHFGRRRAVLTGPYGSEEYEARNRPASVALGRGNATP
jgi:3D (Asp-Asp-Asp) domain-containing protein